MEKGSYMANIVTAKEVGNYLKLSESTIYKLAASGELPGFKIGDSWRFDMEEVIRLIRGSQKPPPPRDLKAEAAKPRAPLARKN